jgi:hypothetical protein
VLEGRLRVLMGGGIWGRLICLRGGQQPLGSPGVSSLWAVVSNFIARGSAAY